MTSQNVEASLMEKKSFRRKPGHVPYPAVHSNCTSNFDIWDSMFINSCCRSLSMHQFEKPPMVILDLGCGSGFWAIEAAKHWATSTVVGYDIKATQPDLFRPDLKHWYADIAHRVRWVHGNLLDGLDFPCAHFDFVRIVNIGLGVPEDEWQFVFEEVARVMKPGSVLELIEEDPIFPCEQPPPRIVRSRPQLSPITVNLSMSESTISSAYSNKSSTTLTLDPSWSSTLDERFDIHSSKSVFSLTSPTSSTLSPRSPLSPSSLTNNFAPRESLASDLESIPDPRDHSKLKEAWEAMLTDRFLASNLLSVLPFYLSSSFVDVQSNPPLKVLLPPNSRLLQCTAQRRSTDSTSTEWTILDAVSDRRSCQSTRSSQNSDEPECPFSSTWIPMHLARTVRTVKGCKEAIWEEYRKLFSGHLVTNTTRPKAIIPQIASSREAFEAEWTSWENDMEDRIGMRDTINAQFTWSEPPGEHPDWRVWRSTLDKVRTASENCLSGSSPSFNHRRPIPICRSMRGYVAWKP